MPVVRLDETLLHEVPIDEPFPQAPEVEEPALLTEELPAAFRRSNLVSSLYERVTAEGIKGFQRPPEQAGYDPLNDIAGFEDDARRFFRSQSPAETQLIKTRIGAERKDLEVLARAGGSGMAWSLAAGLVDPAVLLSMGIPLAPGTVQTARAVRVARGVQAQMVADTAIEAAMHGVQETRTPGESMLNVGAGALLVGALGSIATRVPKERLQPAIDALRGELRAKANEPALGEDSAGAARVSTGTTLEDEGIAKGGRAIARVLGAVSPLTRVLSRSRSKAARILAQRVADVPYRLEKHFKGIASPISAESRVKKRANVGRFYATRMLDDSYAAHREAGGTLTRSQFSAEVAAALNRGDVSDVPGVSKVVGWARKVFDEDAAALRELGVEIGDGVVGAKSYFPRVYNFIAMRKNRLDFEERLFRWFKANPKIGAEGDVLAELEAEVNRAEARRAERLKDEVGPEGLAEVDASLEAARRALASGKSKINALMKSGMTRGEANRVIAEHAAKQSADDLAQAAAELEEFFKAAKESRKVARSSRRKVQNTRRRARRLAARVRVLSRQIADLDLDTAPANLAKLEKDLTEAVARLKAKRAELKAAMQAAKGATGDARKTAKATIDRLRAERDELSLEVFQARSYRNAAKLEEDPLKRFGKLDADLVRLRDRLESTRLSAYDMGAAARSVGQIAKNVAKDLAERQARVGVLKEQAKSASKRAEKAVPAPKDDAEIRADVQDVWDHIMGLPGTKADINASSKAAPLKSRVLDVPDELLAPYLVRNFETVMSGYFRAMAPEIETRKLGLDPENFQRMLDDVKDEYRIKQQAAKDNDAKQRLEDQYTSDVRDLQRMYDRLMGNVGPRGDSDYNWIRAARIARLYAYTRLLGGQMLSSIPDYGRLVAQHGLPRTLKATAKFLTNWNFNKLSREDAHRMGTALEMVVDTRAHQMGDLADEVPTDRVAQTMERVGNAFSRWTLMSPWNASMKTLASILEQDAILRFARNPAKMTPLEKAEMARAGIDEPMLQRISAMAAKHAEDEGVLRARTELWEDQEAARVLEDSVLRTADAMIVTRGVGDLPIMMDKELVKTWLQFKTFALASVNRTMIPLAQGLAHGDAKTAQGLLSMMTLGMATYYAKEYAAGREPDVSPERLAAEALNWSGTLGYVPEIWDVAAVLGPEYDDGTTVLPRFSRFESRSPLESWFGPTFGTSAQLLFGTLDSISDGEMTARDVQQLRRTLPFQNLFYTRRLFNAIEGEAAEGIGAEGATVRTFGQRLTEEVPTK